MGLPRSRRPAGWPGAVDEYLTALRAAGRAVGTVRLHRYYLGALADGHRSPWTVTTRDLLAFLAPVHWQPETRKSARAVVRGFYRWAHGSGYLDQDPSVSLPAVRVPAGVPRPTPEHLVRQLLHHEDQRLVFMGMLAAYGGLRVSEISRVHGSDLLDDVLIVKGKGGKVREVPVISPALLARLKAVGDDWAFPNGLGSHLSPGHVSRLLSRALPGRWTGHTLRHRMGTQAYRGSHNLIGVKEVLGHSRLETTQRYVLGDGRDTREAVAAASRLLAV